MKFEPGYFYHIYNRGNNKQDIFFEEKNYQYFLETARKFIFPRCELLAWCLMPNHFHFIVFTTDVSCMFIPRTGLPIQNLVEGFRLGLSAYTKAINSAYERTGNLFQKKTKAKMLVDQKKDYLLTAFHYLHSNPVKAGLANKPGDWPYSSYLEYAGTSGLDICNRKLAAEFLGIQNKLQFTYEDEIVINEEEFY